MSVKNHVKNRLNLSMIHIISSYLPTKKQEQCRKIIIPVKKQKKDFGLLILAKAALPYLLFCGSF